MRLFDKQAPAVFFGSKYAERITIGKPEGGHGYQVHVGPMYSDARGTVKVKSTDLPFHSVLVDDAPASPLQATKKP